MKKFFRISSFVLAFMMIVASFASISVFAGADDPRLTVGGDDSYDINIGVSDATELGVSEVRYVKSNSNEVVTGQNYSVNSGNILVYKFPVPDLSVGKQIDKTIFRFAHCDQNNIKTWSFKKISGNDVSSLTPALITAGENANDGAIAVHFEKTFTSSISYYVKVITVDISSYVQECYRAGQEYFYLALYNSSTYKVWNVANTTVNAADSGFNGADVRPYIYYTETDAGELAYSSSINPTSSDEGVSFVFTNPIAASSVSASEFTVTNLNGEVEVNDEDISVAGSTVTLNKNWEECGYYNVTFSGSVADIFGQQIDISCNTSFEISADSSEASATALPTFGITSSGAVKDGEDSYCKISANGIYVLYKFDISAIDKTKAVIGADFTWTSQANGISNIRVIQVPNGTWTDKTSLTSALADEDYYSVVDGAKGNVVYEWVENFGTSYTYKTHVADVSGAVSKALADSENYITFAFTSNGTHNYLTNGAAQHASQKPYLTVKLAAPSFGAIEASPAKGGIMDGVNAPVEFTLATTIGDDYANGDYIKLIKVSDNSEADITVDVNGPKLTLTPAADLSERSEYKVVLKSGITDVYGNTLEEDKVISRFVSGTALEFYEIKFTSEEAPVYDEMTEIESYNAGDTVTAVAKFKNNSGTDLNAVMIIAVYNSEGDLVGVDAAGGTGCAPANQETQYSKSITIPGNATGTYVKAFIWSDLEDIRPICKDECINQTK